MGHHKKRIIYVQPFPGNRVLFMDSSGIMSIWNHKTGRISVIDTNQYRLPNSRKRAARLLPSVGILPDGRLVTAHRDYTLKIWDMENNEVKIIRCEDQVTALSVFPDGRFTTVQYNEARDYYNENTLVKYWDLNKKEVITIETKLGLSIIEQRCLIALPDGRIATAGYGSTDKHGTTKIWDIVKGEVFIVKSMYTYGLEFLGMLNDTTAVSLDESSRRLLFWDFGKNMGGSLSMAGGHWIDTTSFCALSDKRFATSMHSKANIRYPDIKYNIEIWDMENEQFSSYSAGSTCITAQGNIPNTDMVVAGCHDGTIKVWDISQMEKVHEDGVFDVLRARQKSAALPIDIKEAVSMLLRRHRSIRNAIPVKTLKCLYSKNRDTKRKAFAALCESGDERIIELLMLALIDDIQKDDINELIEKLNIIKGHYVTSLTKPTKVNFFEALVHELRKNESSEAKRILGKLKKKPTMSVVRGLRSLSNMGLFQPLIDSMADPRSSGGHYGTLGDLVKEFFENILFKLVDESEIEQFLEQRPVIWQPGGMPTWDGRECREGEDECCSSRAAAETYLIRAYQIAPYVNVQQAKILRKRLKVLKENARDFTYYAGGAHRDEEKYEEFSYVHIRDLINKIRVRLGSSQKEGAIFVKRDYRNLGIIDLDKLLMSDPVGNKAKSFAIFKGLGLEFPPGIALTVSIVQDILSGDEEILDIVVDRVIEYFGIEEKWGIGLAVRSSPKTSMPGVLKTRLSVTNKHMLRKAIKDVAKSWNSKKANAFKKAHALSKEVSLGIVIQKVVGKETPDSTYAGVAFSRNPDTGEQGIFGRYAALSGEESNAVMVSGEKKGEPLKNLNKHRKLKKAYRILEQALKKLENKTGYPQEVEFIIEGEKVYFLQTRNIRFIPTVEVKVLEEKSQKDPSTLARIEELQARMKKRKLYTFDPHGKKFKPLFESDEFLPGAMAGYLALSTKKARELAREGKAVILVETPEMRDVMETMYSIERIGLISKRYRNAVCHGAILARGEGIACLIDPPDIEVEKTRLKYGSNKIINEGDMIVINDGKVYGSIFDDEHKEDYYLTEIEADRFAPFGIDISDYRLSFRSPYVDRNGVIIFLYDELLELNAEWDAKLNASIPSGDEERTYRLNLEKHYLHELLFEKGEGEGKSDKEIRKDHRRCISESVRKSYDTELTTTLLTDLISAQLREDRIYEIKYDTSRLSRSQVAIVETYIALLRKRAVNPNNIKKRPFSSTKGSRESLIAVYCIGDKHKGEGHIDVSIQDSSINDYLLRITGMLNIAFAASHIPNNVKRKDIDEKYGSIVGFIKWQYKNILGIEFILPDTLVEIRKTLRNIVLALPKTYKISSDKIELYNKLARKALESV